MASSADCCSSKDNLETHPEGNEEEFRKFYVISKIMNRGSFGIVYEGLRIADNALVAVKKVLLNDILEWEEVNGVRTPMEVVILRKLAHVPGVVKLIEAFDCKSHYMIVMERLEHSVNFEDHVIQKTLLTESKAREYIKQIITILIACYDAGVVHRDVKPGNILLDLSTDKLLIIDFGSAAYLTNEPFSGIVGAIVYCPPESFISKQYYSDSSTVWAIGALLYEMLNGEFPFLTERDICSNELTFIKQLSPVCKDIIRQCLQKNPERRPNLKSLLSHPFFSGAD